ncbi:MAG: aminotransferase class V-fold PLP-dependent enzyme [Thomasclavelia sp.]
MKGVIGLGAAIEYLMAIGMDNIHKYELEFRKYAVKKLLELDNIEVYNPMVMVQLLLILKGFLVRMALHYLIHMELLLEPDNIVPRFLDEFLNVSQTLRASFYFYNTFEEIDKFIEVCKKGDDFLDAFFG